MYLDTSVTKPSNARWTTGASSSNKVIPSAYSKSSWRGSTPPSKIPGEAFCRTSPLRKLNKKRDTGDSCRTPPEMTEGRENKPYVLIQPELWRSNHFRTYITTSGTTRRQDPRHARVVYLLSWYYLVDSLVPKTAFPAFFTRQNILLLTSDGLRYSKEFIVGYLTPPPAKLQDVNFGNLPFGKMELLASLTCWWPELNADIFRTTNDC